MENNKNIISEELRKIYSLMGIKKSLLNEDDEDLSIETPSPTGTPKYEISGPFKSDQLGPDGDFNAFGYDSGGNKIKEPPKGTSSDPLGSFSFGSFGKVYYVKEGFQPYYLTNPVNIAKLFGLTGKPNIGMDIFGYFEEFEKSSWSETAFTPGGGMVQSAPKIKRYFPTPQWSDFQFLIRNKIPFGFKNQGKFYTLVIKLTDPNSSVFPADSDASRGWSMSFPGMVGAGGQDYGSPYYEVGTLQQYNMVAPTVEGDPSTFALDTRSGFDKFMDSGVGQLSIVLGTIILTLLTRGWVTRALTTPGSALFTTSAMQIQTRLVIASTLTEMGINIPQAVYYFNRGGEYSQVGFLSLCFCALPIISKQPGFINLIGQEFSPSICNSLAVKAVGNQAKSALAKGEYEVFLQTLTMEERSLFLNFIESYTKNPTLIENSFKKFLKDSEWASMSAKGIVPDKASQEYSVYIAALEIKKIIGSPTESFVSSFGKNIGGVVTFQQFLLGAYNKFISNEENKKEVENNKNKAKEFEENAKKVDKILEDKLSSFEKLIMEKPSRQLTLTIYEITPEHQKQMFEDGLLPDKVYEDIRKAGIATAIDMAKTEINTANKNIDKITEASNLAINYLSNIVCWDEIVSAGYEVDASNVLTKSGYVKTDDNTICNSARKKGSDPNKSCTTSPCWVKPSVTTDETTINPNVTTDTSKNRYSCSSGKCTDVGEGKGRYLTPDCNNSCTTNKKVTEPLNPEEVLINKPGYGTKK
jgi:hypothetical protein